MPGRVGALDTAAPARRAAVAGPGPGVSPQVRQHLSTRPTTPADDPVDLLGEHELVERAKKDPEAFGMLYERHRGRVYRFACSKLGSWHHAEDLTAEVFMRA